MSTYEEMRQGMFAPDEDAERAARAVRAARGNPDTEAEARRIARQIGEVVPFTRQYMDDARLRAQAADVAAQTRGAPHAARFVERNADVARDDAGTLADSERAIAAFDQARRLFLGRSASSETIAYMQRFAQPFRRDPPARPTGRREIEYLSPQELDRRGNQAVGELFERDRMRRGAGQARQGGENILRSLGAAGFGMLQGAAGLYEAAQEGRISAPGDTSAMLRRQAVEDGADLGRAGRQWRQYFRGRREALRPESTGSAIIDAALGGVESIPLSLVGLGTSIITRSPTAGLAFVGATVGGESYGEGRDEGLDPAEALGFGAVDAAIEVVTERLPLLRFLEDTEVGTPFMRRFLRNMAGEQIGEQYATALQDLNRWATIEQNQGKTFGDYLRERPAAARDTAIATLVTVSGTNATVASAQMALSRRQRREAQSEQTEITQNLLGRLTELSEASALRERDTSSFEAFIESAAEGTDATDVFLDPEQLEIVLDQDGIDADAFIENNPEIESQIEEAIETGRDIRIPISEFAGRVAGSDVGEALMPHLKLSPDEMSQSEAETFFQSAAEEIEAEAEASIEELGQTEEFNQSAERVTQSIEQELTTANRFTGDVNRAYASLVGSFYATLAARSGQTPEQVAETYRLQVQAESVEGEGVLDQWSFDTGDVSIEASSVRDGYIEINRIETPTEARGAGLARRAMEQVIERADAEGVTVFLTPEPLDDTTTKEGLTEFYKSLGFVPNKGKTRDFRSRASMVREPQPSRSTPVTLPDAIEIDGVERPTQIKSAIGNRGTFDPSDARILNQDAYHASPSEFGAFSLEHVGKGLGVLAYGHGLYFTNRRSIADFYRAALAKEQGDAHVYEAQIPDGDQYLIWEKPLSEQPQRVLDALASVEAPNKLDKQPRPIMSMIDPERMAGGDLYRDLQRRLGSDREASRVLNEAGVAGVRYIDARAEKNGAHNYVVFDPARAEVTAYYQSNPFFYSQLERTIAESKTNQAPAEQWINTLQKAPGIKQEELEWTGVIDALTALAERDQMVTREDLLAIAEQGGVVVEEVLLGGEEGFDDQTAFEAYLEREMDEQFGGEFDRQMEDARADAESKFSFIIEQTTEGRHPDLFEEYDTKIYRDEFSVVVSVKDDDIIDMRFGSRIEANEFAIDWQEDRVAEELDDQENEIRERVEEYIELHAREAWVNYDRDEWRVDHNDAFPGATKWGEWTTTNPNDETYRELLFTLPKAKSTPSTHWDREGVVAHVRFNEKRDDQSRRVMFIEEVQSDWHQKGRDKGYAVSASKEEIDAAREDMKIADAAVVAAEEELARVLIGAVEKVSDTEDFRDDEHAVATFQLAQRDMADPRAPASRKVRSANAAFRTAIRVANLNETSASVEKAQEKVDELNLKAREAASRFRNARVTGIPDAPFKTTWPALVMKRAVRYAADHGFERVAWTTGEQQNDRYDLGTVIDKLFVRPGEDGNVIFDADNMEFARTVVENSNAVRNSGSEVSMDRETAIEVFGRDLGTRAFDAGLAAEETIEVEDLRVGGEGMIGFYDRNLGNITNKIIKKHGAKVKPLSLPEFVVETSQRKKEIREAERELEEYMKREIYPLNEKGEPGEYVFVTIPRSKDQLEEQIELARRRNDPDLEKMEAMIPKYDKLEEIEEKLEVARMGAQGHNSVVARAGQRIRELYKELEVDNHPVIAAFANRDKEQKEEIPPTSPDRLKATIEFLRVRPAEIIAELNGRIEKLLDPNDENYLEENKEAYEKRAEQIAQARDQIQKKIDDGGYDQAIERLENEMPALIEDYENKLRAREEYTSPATNLGFDMTPELIEAAGSGFPLFHNAPLPRGQIQLPVDLTLTPATITLLRGADLSTFLHETGHFFFEVMTTAASQPGADPELLKDANKLVGFAGAESVEHWRAMTPEDRREGHEKIARAFEAYLYEGRAADPAMRSLFQRFSDWLKRVYNSISQLDVELTDEVRGVFDRMLATEEQIAEGERDAGFIAALTEKPEGMSDSEWEKYQQLGAEATTTAQEELQARSLRDMKYAGRAAGRELKRLQKQIKGQRESVRAEVAEEVALEPVYQAIELLRKGMVEGDTVEPVKLSIQAIDEMYAERSKEERNEIKRKLGYGKYGMLAKEGEHPDIVAQGFGFDSGDHMVQEILLAPKFDERVEADTDQRMLERYGDITSPEAMQAAVEKAIHNDVRARFVATEVKAMAKAPGSVRELQRAAKRYAQTIIGQQQIGKVRPKMYEAAERRAMRKAAEATDPVEAGLAKRNQLLNMASAKEARDAIDEMEKALRYLRKFEREGTRKNVDAEYLEQIDAILEAYEMRTGVSGKAMERRRSLAQWVELQRERGMEPIFEAEDMPPTQHWRELTVNDARAVIDSVRNIEHLGRLKKKLLTAKDQREFANAVGDIVGSIKEHSYKTIKQPFGSKTWWERTKSAVTDFFMVHRKMANVVQVMDGNKQGVFWNYFIRPMNEAGDREASMNEAATRELTKIFKPMLKNNNIDKREFDPVLDRSVSLQDKIMVALNWGNEANRQRVMDGDKLSLDQVEHMLSSLTREHWEFVEKVWKFIGSYWPDIAAKEKRVTGLEPEKVEAAPFTTPTADGGTIELAGGYFPIKYDADKSSRAEADEASEVQRQIERGHYARAQTRRGHIKARVEKVERPVRKDFGVIFEHVAQVVHDLSWHEYLIDANRLLNSASIDATIRDHYGPEALRWMKKALVDIAIGDIPALSSFERGMTYLRAGATIAGLGWKVWTSLLQPVGITQSIARVGPKYMAMALPQTFNGAVGLESVVESISEKSEFMRLRAKTMQREINEVRNVVSGKSQWKQNVELSYFYFITKLQYLVDAPTWVAGYMKAIDQGHDEARAIAMGDQAVIDAQTGGQIKDLSYVQRGGVWQKLWTNFYSFMNGAFNILADSSADLRRKGVKGLPTFVADVALVSILPSIIIGVMRQFLYGDGEEPEDYVESVTDELISFNLGLLLGVRETSAALSGNAGYEGPAGARIFAALNRFGQQARQGEVDEAAIRAANQMAGVLFHYPAGQIDASIRGTRALVEEDDQGPQAVLVGPRR